MKGRRAATNAFIVAYLCVQLLVPLRGLLMDKSDTRGDFSWNMYAGRYTCLTSYMIRTPGGMPQIVDHRPYFKREKSSGKIFHRDVLPVFHAWLCDELHDALDPARLEAWVSCRTDEEPTQALVLPGTDICAAAEHGGERP